MVYYVEAISLRMLSRVPCLRPGRGASNCVVVPLHTCSDPLPPACSDYVVATVHIHGGTNRGGPRGGFIPAETLLQNGTAGRNDTAGGTLNQPVLYFLVGLNPL